MTYKFDIDDYCRLNELVEELGDAMEAIRANMQTKINTYEQAAGEWNGDESGAQEDAAMIAKDKMELYQLLLNYIS